MIFTAQVKVMPLKELLDPQGKAVMGGLANLGLKSIQDVRIGKNITLQIEAETAESAKAIAEEAAKKAKANDILLRVHGFKGYIMQTLGAYEEALKVYYLTLNAAEDILSKEPNNKQYNSNLQTNLESIFILGNIFHNNGYFLQAKSCFELHLSISQKLLAIDPENVTYLSNVGGALNDLGNLFRDMGRLEETKQKLDKALEIDETAILYNNKGAVYFDLEKCDQALECYKKAEAADPNLAQIYMNKGHIQFDLSINNNAQQIIGKMIHADEHGCVIISESTGVEHCYNWDVIVHICEAP